MISNEEGDKSGGDSAIDSQDREGLEYEAAAMCYKAKTEADCEQIELPRLKNCDDCWQKCFWQTLVEIDRDESKGCHFGKSIEACGYVSGGLTTCLENDMTCGVIQDQEASVFAGIQGTQYLSTGICSAMGHEGLEYVGRCSWSKSGDKHFLTSGEAVCRCLCEP